MLVTTFNHYNMKKHLIIPILSLVFLACCGGMQVVQAQSTRQEKDSIKTARISALIDQQEFVFKADMAYPMGGRSKNLSSDYYDLRVSKDTVVAYLPYYGRAYSAPIDPSKGGIQFTSTNFDYSVVPAKKGGWNITIKTKDGGDAQQLFLSVSTSGYANLQVSSVSRQSISFSGRISSRTRGK